MTDKKTLEIKLAELEALVEERLPNDPEKSKAALRFLIHTESAIEQRKQFLKDPFLKDASQRYFGLDPLKISALNVAFGIEAEELRYCSLQLELCYSLMLANVIRIRLVPNSGRKLKTEFTAEDLSHYPVALEMMQRLIEEMELEKGEKGEEIASLRKTYEEYLFVESSHDASRSFGAKTPNIRDHHSSWVAFAQLLTSLAVRVHETETQDLIRKSRKIDAKREATFERCAEIFTKMGEDKDAKKIRRQLSTLKAEIEKLNAEIESTLAELSVPGIHDDASFIMKKTSDGSKTSERNTSSQSTGDKT